MPDKKNGYWVLVPIMLSFFAMGFVDAVGVATHYVKADFNLSDSVANLFPSMVFFWFLVCSVPTGMLMNKIGRRKTVLASLIVTAVALALPLVNYSFGVMMASFALLGIGNTLMQVSLNPLLSNVVAGEKLASVMTFGQFIKAIASFSAPLLAGWAALRFGSWKYLYLMFLAEAAVAFLFLAREKIKEEEVTGKASSFADCFRLLGDGFIFFCFLGIVCHVGVDVGVNVTAPRLLMDRAGADLTQAGYASSVYFLFRTLGCFLGAFVLARCSAKKFFMLSAGCIALSMAGMVFLQGAWPLYACMALVGFGNSNIFPIIFSQAILHNPQKKNEVSGLMIMGLFGGTLFPLAMGLTADAVHSQTGAVLVMSLGALYLLWMIKNIRAQAA
ncbi:MAG: MFS transporter [Elusimicrobiales bacterium]|nr:MFS transporter [Elusimicrobiales bacterium]